MPKRPPIHRPAWYKPAEQRKKESDAKRPSAHQRGYGHKWRKARQRYLEQHPLCVMCERDGKVVSATVVDHIVPHKGDMKLFWRESNWQSLCARHHNIKTMDEGSFGN